MANRLGASATTSNRRPGFSIQSKLLVMLLAVSIGSSLVVGLVGYVSGRDSLRNAAYARLTDARESKAREITDFFSDTENALAIYSRSGTVVDATADFAAGFDQLQDAQLAPAQNAAVDALYADTFAPGLAAQSGQQTDPAAFDPTSPAERYLQYQYTDKALDYDKSIQVDDAGDGSAWSAANAKYQDYFRTLIDKFGYEDALLLDTNGNVVYSAYKGVDLGTNVNTGPYKGTSLATGFRSAHASSSADSVAISDFEPYQPSNDKPTMWIMSPVGSTGGVTGVMALQISLDAINSIMTADDGWQNDGLGSTGETYLAGPDELMRSTSRELVENPEQYEKDVVSAGTPPDTAARAVQVNGTVLLQPVRTPAVENALQGQTGIVEGASYLGTQSIAASAPLDIAGLHWVIVARVDSSEAFAAVDDFTRNMIIAIVTLIVIVSLLSLLLAQVFARPVRRLVGAVRNVAGGDLSVEVPPGSRDEFGNLGNAFNDMSRSLRIKQSLIDEQTAEKEKLLSTLMPASVAKRYKEGHETIADSHQDVSVLFADLIGYDDFARSLTPERELALLNGIVAQFDAAAARAGVETVRTLREGYLASCGLAVPRVDNVRRMLDFALAITAVIERFNAQQSSTLSLRIGIDAGAVSSGLVGRTSLAYDMWGEAVNLANRVQRVSGDSGIFVSQSVRDQMRDAVTFSQVGTIEINGAAQGVWMVL